MNGFQNGNAQIPTSGCGYPSNVPGVAVYQPEVTCPTNGFGASTFEARATTVVEGLTPPTAKASFASSTAVRRVFIGNFDDLSEMCLARIAAEVGGPIVDFCDPAVATLNGAGMNLCCALDLDSKMILGLVAKTSDALSELSATQILFDPCNPCFASSTNFVCANGCNDNSNFILNNAVVGRNAGLVIEIPANIALNLDVCTCSFERTQYSGCPIAAPAMAQVVSTPICPPYDNVQPGFNGQPGFSAQQNFNNASGAFRG